MKITIIAIGKKHDPKLAAALEDYSERIKHYAKLEWKVLESKAMKGGNVSNELIKNSESEVILSSLSSDDVVILLDETGAMLDSPALAKKLQSYMNNSVKNLVFVIGGAYGVNQVLMERANFIWSLSQLVFPHQLVRLLLVEQLYRAYSIIACEKYHHN